MYHSVVKVSDWPHTFLHPRCFCLAYKYTCASVCLSISKAKAMYSHEKSLKLVKQVVTMTLVINTVALVVKRAINYCHIIILQTSSAITSYNAFTAVLVIWAPLVAKHFSTITVKHGQKFIKSELPV